MLRFQSLTRTFPGGVRALDELTFSVPSGSVFGFLGGNGAGKTTAMRAVFGLTTLDSGEVTWRDSPITTEMRRTFGYMPEERGLYPDMGVAAQVAFFGRLHGMDPGAAASAAEGWLTRLGLSDRLLDNLEDLSMGNQQRVQLAASLVHEPQLLVLDEPFSGLDPEGTDMMSDVLREWATGGRTVLFSSHQLDLVEHICDSVAIIESGRLLLEGAVSELRDSGPARYEVTVTGDPEANWAQGPESVGVLEGVEDAVATVRLDEGVDGQLLLKAALAAGPVERFARNKRRLSQVFRDRKELT